MIELLAMLFSILIIFLACFIGWLIAEVQFKIKDKLNHTLFKEKYIAELICGIKEGVKFNNYKINKYKGIKDEKSIYDEFEEHCCICRCCDSKFYISEGIDTALIEEFNQSELEAKRLNVIYSEQRRKENLQSRLEFIETEIKDIKTRL